MTRVKAVRTAVVLRPIIPPRAPGVPTVAPSGCPSFRAANKGEECREPAGVTPAIAVSLCRLDCWPHVARLSTVTGEAGTCPTRIKQAALIALRSEVEPAGFAPAMPITVPCSPPLPRTEAGAHALKGMLEEKGRAAGLIAHEVMLPVKGWSGIEESNFARWAYKAHALAV